MGVFPLLQRESQGGFIILHPLRSLLVSLLVLAATAVPFAYPHRPGDLEVLPAHKVKLELCGVSRVDARFGYCACTAVFCSRWMSGDASARSHARHTHFTRFSVVCLVCPAGSRRHDRQYHRQSRHDAGVAGALRNAPAADCTPLPARAGHGAPGREGEKSLQCAMIRVHGFCVCEKRRVMFACE